MSDRTHTIPSPDQCLERLREQHEERRNVPPVMLDEHAEERKRQALWPEHCQNVIERKHLLAVSHMLDVYVTDISAAESTLRWLRDEIEQEREQFWRSPL